MSIGCARTDRANPWGDFSGQMHRVELFYETLSSAEIELLAGLGSVKSFTTGSQAVPPIAVTRPATKITDSNATISYELVSMMVHSPRLFSIGVVLTSKRRFVDFRARVVSPLAQVVWI